MIQRIQSVFLFLASLSLWSLFKIPFALSDVETTPFFEDRLFSIQDHSVLLALTIIGGLCSFVAIFMFKKRENQMRLGYVGIICSLFIAIAAFWLIYSNSSQMSNAVIEDQIGLYIPIISLILIIIANMFIKKDVQLVQSMDRLR